ncbi:alpha-amylase family glycosyl hydrolase [Fulvivirga lutea]|uniref:Alpha-glucosidase C-terminal domain-containing protein n=1 Tax=Fulvivirga lutea TaxID=2810512 RepID=A0A974ZZI1_9BACT|nr:alpha-amylase family glycosyl hydrolase [Fulvivirga lutea]QSE96234.1 alpha-glucosidase C-terminal domain-containing protein [Fulvivirga lutea]
MKHKILVAALLTAIVFGCEPKKSTEEVTTEESTLKFPEKAKGMNIYEVNVRQYTKEGTIKAFQSHLPRLKEMGVDILWIMPVQPISEKNRKGPLGSYYSIQDYTAVNPNFGTEADFKDMVDEAHKMGMYVILDWVANHTGFDHAWVEKEGYHNTDSLGNVTWPAGTDWTDVADLNYDNQEMRQEMITEMDWWLTEMDIDGFRCDVAGEVPQDFWTAAIDSLEQTKDIFMLAEWDEPWLHEAGFHMTYAWGPHHWMNETAKGHIDVDSLESLIKGDIERYGNNDFRMMFTTNHDENSWNGTVFERFGEGHLAWAVWAFTVRGMPLIYSGQEAGLSKRLRFFDKDTISFDSIPYEKFYTKLLELKHTNAALHNGQWGGNPEFIDDGNNNVSSFIREYQGNKVAVIVNLSGEKQSIHLQSIANNSELNDWMTGKSVILNEDKSTELNAYEYLVLVLK